MNFQDHFDTLPEWQQSRFRLIQMAISVELSETEKLFLIWLAGQDMERVDQFIDIIGKVKA